MFTDYKPAEIQAIEGYKLGFILEIQSLGHFEGDGQAHQVFK